MNTKKQQGIVYTPAWIVNKILTEAGFDGSHGKIIDPACGDGAFLSAIVERILQCSGSADEKRKRLASDVYGMDIDPEAISACKKRLSALAQRQILKMCDGRYFAETHWSAQP